MCAWMKYDSRGGNACLVSAKMFLNPAVCVDREVTAHRYQDGQSHELSKANDSSLHLFEY